MDLILINIYGKDRSRIDQNKTRTRMEQERNKKNGTRLDKKGT